MDENNEVKYSKFSIMKYQELPLKVLYDDLRRYGVYILTVPFRLNEDQMKLILQMTAQMHEDFSPTRDSLTLVVPEGRTRR